MIAEALATAIEDLDSAQEQVADLQARLSGVLGADPQGRMRAEAWIGRTRTAEKMLRELVYWVDQNPSVEALLPTAFISRSRAQLHAIEIRERDFHLKETPMGDWWELVRVTPGD